LGADFDTTDPSGVSSLQIAEPSIKARYRGQDRSELDPDYVRAPVYGVTYFPVPSQIDPSRVGYDTAEQYPSLNEAYRPAVQPRRT
jgi:hypothetical protein